MVWLTTPYGVAVPILYTPGQLRKALGISKETLRYWKKDIPALGGRQDQRPRFEASDLLATAIVKRVTEVAGIPISRLAPVSDELFSLCKAYAWPQLERMSAVFLFDTDELQFVSGDMPPFTDTALIIPLRPTVNSLREHLHHAEFDAQSNFAFPPFALSKGAGQ